MRGVVGKAEQGDGERVRVQELAVPVDHDDARRYLVEHVARGEQRNWHVFGRRHTVLTWLPSDPGDEHVRGDLSG
jgi:hypothetical protein